MNDFLRLMSEENWRQQFFANPKPVSFFAHAIFPTNPPAQPPLTLFFASSTQKTPILCHHNKSKSPQGNRTLFSLEQKKMINSTESILFVKVPTIKEEHHQEMDMRRLSKNAMITLRTKDPFMYYSIPEVHRATFTLQEVEYAKTISPQTSPVVTRKTWVSTECHSSLLMEEFLQDEEFESLGSALVNRLADGVESDIEQPPEQQ